jgi:site-specific DNA recombinase
MNCAFVRITVASAVAGDRGSTPLDSGADPAVVSGWIAQTEAARTLAESDLRRATGRSPMSGEEIRNLLAALGDLRSVIRTADPAERRRSTGSSG